MQSLPSTANSLLYPLEPYMISHERVVPSSCSSWDTDNMTALPLNFVPGPMDCICARGRRAFHHEGNMRFRKLIQSNLSRYAKAKTKLDKSIIVSSVINSVRGQLKFGGFVKEVKKRWFEVGDHLAREKVGQSFRDLLHGQYKSSTKAKQTRRKEIRSVMGNEIGHFMKSNKAIAKKMKQISTQSFRGSTSSVTEMFDEANVELLRLIKATYPTMESLEGMLDEPSANEHCEADTGSACAAC